MARINLLPWRVQRRRHRQRQFLAALVASALAALLLSVLIGNYYRGQIAGQNARNHFLHQKIAAVQRQIEQVEVLDQNKAMLLKRQQILERLQADHAQMVHLFDALVRALPDGMMLTSIVQEDRKLTLEGRSQSNTEVSRYMRALAGLGWVAQPELSVIEARPGDLELPFGFRLMVNPESGDPPEQIGSAAANIRPTAASATMEGT